MSIRELIMLHQSLLAAFLIASVSGKFIDTPIEPRQVCLPPHCDTARGDGPIVIPYQNRDDPIAIPDDPIAIPDGPSVIPYQNRDDPIAIPDEPIALPDGPSVIPYQNRDDPIAIPDGPSVIPYQNRDDPIAIPHENKQDCPPPHCDTAREARPLIHF